jgi:MFS family permease
VFASRNVTGANVIQTLMVAALFSFQVLIALYMQNVLGYSAGETGLAMLPCAAAIAVVSLLVAAPLIARFGERRVLVAGLALLTGGIGLLTRLPAADARYVTDLLPTMLSGAGFGLAITALTTLAMSAARPDDAGLASGLFNTTQQVGGAVGLAVLGTIAAASTGTALAGGAGRAAALTGGFHVAFTVATGLLLAALVLALTVLRRPEPAAAPAGAPAPETARI